MIQLRDMCLPATAFMAAGPDGAGPEVPGWPERGTAVGLNRRVLIVEDEALVAMNMADALAEAGFEILGTVDTEDDAVAAAERLRPDVVLIDITLREGNGISAARAIQEKLKTCIVFISGNSDPRTLAAASRINPSGFIRKPFVTDRLVKLVQDAIATKN